MDIEKLEREADEQLDSMMNGEAPTQPEEGNDPPEAEAADTQQPEPDEHPEANASEPNDAGKEVEPAQTDEVAELKGEVQKLEERYVNAQRRMTQAIEEAADLRKENASLRGEINSLKAASTKPDDAGQGDVDDMVEKLTSMTNEYPDFAPLAEATRKALEKVGAVEKTVEMTERQHAENQAKAEYDAYMAAITSAIPDAQLIAQSPEFDAWLAGKPGFYRKAVFGNGEPGSAGTADEVVAVLSEYKQSLAPPKPNKVEEAKKLATPTVRTQQPAVDEKPSFTPRQIANMSLEEFAKHEDQIDEWMAANA